MTSVRHKSDEIVRQSGDRSSAIADDVLLDAARDALLAVGWSRTTLTDIARRAGVSRMTIYRRWPDTDSLLGDLMAREWTSLLTLSDEGSQLDRLVHAVTGTVAAMRGNPLFSRLLELDAELLLPYLLQRPGRSQLLVMDLLADLVRAGQKEGSIRDGDPDLLARSVLLLSHGFAISAGTMTRPRRSRRPAIAIADLDTELAHALREHLTPRARR